jgi:hypothetical protein
MNNPYLVHLGNCFEFENLAKNNDSKKLCLIKTNMEINFSLN